MILFIFLHDKQLDEMDWKWQKIDWYQKSYRDESTLRKIFLNKWLKVGSSRTCENCSLTFHLFFLSTLVCEISIHFLIKEKDDKININNWFGCVASLLHF